MIKKNLRTQSRVYNAKQTIVKDDFDDIIRIIIFNPMSPLERFHSDIDITMYNSVFMGYACGIQANMADV